MATSAHFSDSELACQRGTCPHCGGQNLTTQLLVDSLEALRAVISASTKVDTPVHVNDAYRCPAHNLELGNAALRSQHVLGTAADIRVEGITAADLYRYVLQIPAFQGIGRDDHKQYVHVDVRTTEAKWCYNSSGKQIPWSDVIAA